jgi:hypothetical protein
VFAVFTTIAGAILATTATTLLALLTGSYSVILNNFLTFCAHIGLADRTQHFLVLTAVLVKYNAHVVGVRHHFPPFCAAKKQQIETTKNTPHIMYDATEAAWKTMTAVFTLNSPLESTIDSATCNR